MRSTWFWLAMLASTACHDSADTSVPDVSDLDAPYLFALYCEACHGGDGTGTANGPDITGIPYAPETLVQLIQEGTRRMPRAAATYEEAWAIALWIQDGL
jgi:mono/diheme cytochrome c family protein